MIKKSIFFKYALFILPIVFFLDVGILFFSYQTIYNGNLESCHKNIKNAASIAAFCFENFDPYKLENTEKCCQLFDSLCEMLDLTYVYAVKPDLAEKSEQYLAIGFGDDSSEEARQTRYSGVVVAGKLNQEEIEAFNGNLNGTFKHEFNKFGETLICYMPVTRHYDMRTKSFVENETVSFAGAEMSITSVVENFQKKFNFIILVTVFLSFVIVIAVVLSLYIKISKPIIKISNRMKGFVSDREKNFEKLEVRGNDELADMSHSFNLMAEEIDKYLSDISELNRQKHMQEAELQIAKNIQCGLLPPSEFKRSDALINAYMLPARDIGGDLYDYKKLPDGKLFMAIADVSGKGVSAALFMARAITLLHQYAEKNFSPSDILHEYNNHLVRNNPNGMFITTFVAVYDPKSGTLTYSNAGHNSPYILSDQLVTLEGSHGMAAGVFLDAEYNETVVKMRAGDTLFLYTDGVNEAQNVEHQLFGTPALESALKNCIYTGDGEVLRSVLRKVETFMEGTEQSDDITILTFKVNPQPFHQKLIMKAQVQNLEIINEAIRSIPGITEKLKQDLTLLAEEIFVNICSYAYEDQDGEVEVTIDVSNKAVITFSDSGHPFNPTDNVLNIEEYQQGVQVGGLGRFLIQSISDKWKYEYKDSKNIFTVIKNIVLEESDYAE